MSSVYLVYNEFRSVIPQRVVVERLLPIPKLEPESPAINTVDYLFEPSPEELLNVLLPYHVSVQVARALLESSAAEHAARMTAMDAATRNAKDMVDRLTLYMNKVRQAVDHPRDHRDRRGRAVGLSHEGTEILGARALGSAYSTARREQSRL